MKRIHALVLVALLSLGCSGAQRQAECQAAPGALAALDVVVSVIVDAITGGQAVNPVVADAITSIEAFIGRTVTGAVCGQTPAQPAASARLRAAMIAHPVPHTVTP